jgi:hypothetical protein
MYPTPTPVATAERQEVIAAPVACANCGTAVELHYCPNCGQKHAEGRLHMGHLFSEFAHNYLGTDSGFFFTVREMLVRPGHAINEFLDGKRRPYLKPVQFYLLLLTLFFVVSELLNVNPLEMGNQVNRDLGIQPGVEVTSGKKYQRLMEVLATNMKVIFSLLLLVLALTLKLLYRKKPYTFTELLVFSLYIYGVSYLFSCVLAFLMVMQLPHAVHATLNAAVYGLSAVYVVWAIRQFYGGSGVRGWLKAGSSYLLSIFLLMLFSGILGAVVSITGKLMGKL